MHLSRRYDGAVGLPLVLAFHGATSQPAPTILEDMERETKLSQLADDEAFIVAYPRVPCAPSRPVPLIEFHGTNDKVPYDGGPFGPDTLMPVSRWLQDWADRNRCAHATTLIWRFFRSQRLD